MAIHKILFLAANPPGMPRLPLDEEARNLQIVLERSGCRAQFALEHRWAARREDLIDALRTLAPTVVHFAGHGGSATPRPRLARSRDIVGGDDPPAADPVHGLFFQGPDGQPEIASTAALAEAFRAAGSSVKLVVLNACYSDALAEALLPHVDCVVGMRGPIDDEAARAFAACFYGGLGQSQSIAAAYSQGRAAIHLEGLSDGDRPQLKVRGGLDASRIVLAAPAAASRPRSGLPYELPHEDRLHAFAGRKAELAAMQTELLPHDAAHDGGDPRGSADRPDRPVFVVTGPSGIGKSMLAQKFAADHRAWFDAAVYLTASDAEAMARTMARSLGATDSELRERDVRDVLAERCGDHRVLLTINDAREIQPLKTLLGKLLPPEVAVIVTTQHRSLSSLADRSPEIVALEGPRLRHWDLRALAPNDALTLFTRELGEGAVWTTDEARRICEVLGYLPQALYVVARNCGRDGLWTLSDFLSLFCAGEDRKQLLEEGLYVDEALRLDDDPEPLENVLDKVLTQLEKEPGGRGTVAFYSCLAACDPAGFSVEAAGAAAGYDNPAAARGRLNRLHRHALVDQLSPGSRYALQTLFAASATWRARSDGTHDAARVRHARFWMTRLRAASVSELWLPADLRVERGDLALAATRAAEAGELDVELIEKLNDFFDRAQLPERAVQTMTAAIGCADALDRAAGVLARIRLAKFRPRSEAAATLAELEPVRALIAGLPDAAQRRALEIKLLVRMGALQKRSDRSQAVETLQRAVALAREGGDFHAAGHALDALARVHREAGRIDAALDAARESLQADRGEVSATERFLGGLLIADCLVEQGELSAADARYRECSRLGPRPAPLVHLAGHLLTVAQSLRDRGRLSAAIQIIQLQTEMAGEAGDDWLQVRGLIVLGDARVKAGDIAGALDAYRVLSVDDRRSHLRDTRPVTGTLRKLARDLGELGHPVDMERRALELADQIAKAGQDFATQAIICNRLAHSYRRTQRLAEAEHKFREQVALGKRHGLPIQQTYGYVGLAALHRRAERFDLQIECCQAALDALSCPEGQAAIHSRLLIHTELALGYMHTGQRELAVDTLVQIGALRSLTRTPRSSTGKAPRTPGKPRPRGHRGRPKLVNVAHDVAEMLLSQMRPSAILRLLRDRFGREATPEVAGALVPVALQLAELLRQREPVGVAWSAPLLLALELSSAANALEPQRECLELLRSIARLMRDGAADPGRWSMDDVSNHADNRASTAYSVLSGFFAADRAIARAQALAQPDEATVPELLAAGGWALGCPVAVVRSYVCCNVASWFRKQRWNDHAERFYRAGVDACVAVNDQVHLSYALVSLCSVLRRFEGREAEALECLVRLADGPVPHLADTDPVEDVLNKLARHFSEREPPDRAAWLKAGRALVVVAKRRGSLEGEVKGWNHVGRALYAPEDWPGAVDAFEHQIVVEIASQSGAMTQYGFKRFEEAVSRASDAQLRERAWLHLIDRLEGERGSLANLLRARAWCCLGGHRLTAGRLPEACNAFVHAVLARGLSRPPPDTLQQISSALSPLAVVEQAVEPLLAIQRTAERSRQQAAVLVLREVVPILRSHGRAEEAGRVVGELERRVHAVAPRPVTARHVRTQPAPLRPYRPEPGAPERQGLILRQAALLQRADPRSSGRRRRLPRS